MQPTCQLVLSLRKRRQLLILKSTVLCETVKMAALQPLVVMVSGATVAHLARRGVAMMGAHGRVPFGPRAGRGEAPWSSK